MTEKSTVPDRAVADTEPIVGDSKRALGTFPDRYEANEEIGRGGMGRVASATDRVLGRTVAVKMALETDEDALRRFARETQITARLEHPSIVPVYDAGVSPEGSPFYVMRKVTGRPLDKLVGAAAQLEQRLALLPNVMAACQAVAHAHERGIIHRDLKPSNILVGAHGETIVIDWGLAKSIEERDATTDAREPRSGDSLRTRVGSVFGTPGFMAPEQIQSSSDVDERADVYALGATLFYVLAQRPPHGGKDSDAVEEAAKQAPPPPIASIVPGVPRELSTIVDKALAYNLGHRYRNAGALAEELSRFMTGQLVAAHAYTLREKLARFVRRHRALVAVSLAALLVVAIGGAIAVSRVLSARDEALAQAKAANRARAAETERASDLVVSQARLLMERNPTAAVAMVRPLAGTSRWRDVRAVAAGARAAGVAWRLPSPPGVTALEMSLSGTRALACGSDGSIFVYDLEKRTHANVATLPGRVRATFADETRVLAWSGSTFTLIDTTTRTTKTIERSAKITRVAARDGIAYYVDANHRPWRLDVTTGELTEIPVPGAVSHLAISHDGKRLAFGGDHLWLVEAKRIDLVEKIHDGKKFELAWSTDNEHVVAIGEQAVFDITIHPEIEVGEYRVTTSSAAIARGIVYSSGLNGFTVGRNVIGEQDVASSFAGIHVTKGEFVVAASRAVLRIFDGTHPYEMALPWTPLSFLRASPRSPYVLAVCADLVLVWNVEHIMPQRLEVPDYAQLVSLGPRTAWAVSNSAASTAIDVHSAEARPLLAQIKPLRPAAPRSGAYVVGRPLGSQETLILRPDGTSEAVAFDAVFAAVADEHRVAIATRGRELILYDVAKREHETIAKFDAPIDRIQTREVNPRWIVVTLVDGTLWRWDAAANKTQQTKSSPRSDLFSPGLATSAATRTGDVFFAIGSQLRRWKPDGTVVDHVQLPRPTHTVQLIEETRMLVITDDGTGYVVRTTAPELAKLPAIGAHYAYNQESPLLVTDDRTGGVTVLDLEVNAAWKIARAAPQNSTPMLSGDGRVVVMRDATADATAVALWKLDLPETPEATTRWVDTMTNATFDPRTGMLGWQQ